MLALFALWGMTDLNQMNRHSPSGLPLDFKIA